MSRDWERARERDRMRRRGVASAGDDVSFMRPLLSARPPRPRISKAELRAEANAAYAAWKARQRGGPGE
jgi:hypothetical protein